VIIVFLEILEINLIKIETTPTMPATETLTWKEESYDEK